MVTQVQETGLHSGIFFLQGCLFNLQASIGSGQCLQMKTRCSPRTRMQSRRTLVCNKLFEQSATSYLNSLVHFAPVTVAVHCRLWNAKEGGVQSVGHEESGVLSGKCSV